LTAVVEGETVDADSKPRAMLVLAGQRTAAVTLIKQYNSIIRLHPMRQMQTIVTDVRGVSLSRGSTVCCAFLQPLPNHFGLLLYTTFQIKENVSIIVFITLTNLARNTLKKTA